MIRAGQRRRWRSRSSWIAAVMVAVVAILVPAATATPASAQPDRFHTPPIKHVFLIILENKSYEATFTGLNKNSYLWETLPKYGELLRQYYGTGHYSNDNYLSLIAGQAESVNLNETGQAAGSVSVFSVEGSLIQAAFGSFGGCGVRRNRPGLAA